MAKISIEVDEERFFSSSGAPGITGPGKGDVSSAWMLYLPGQTPCICDTFEEAAAAMRDYLRPRVCARRSRAG
jgi:hypothetical protein